MGWSLTNYDSLRLLYTDIKGDSFLIRKSLTTFRILWEQANFVEMFVKADVFLWSKSGAPLYPTTSKSFQQMPLSFTYPWTQSLHYDDADNPITNNAVDLIGVLNDLLLSSDLKVQKNGVFVGERQSLNFIEGANVSITGFDDSVNDRVDITIAATGSGDDPFPKILMLMGG